MIEQKNAYFDSNKSKILKDWLEEDNKEFQVIHQAQVKRKEWLYKNMPVIYLHAIVWSCILWGVVDGVTK